MDHVAAVALPDQLEAKEKEKGEHGNEGERGDRSACASRRAEHHRAEEEQPKHLREALHQAMTAPVLRK